MNLHHFKARVHSRSGEIDADVIDAGELIRCLEIRPTRWSAKFGGLAGSDGRWWRLHIFVS